MSGWGRALRVLFTRLVPWYDVEREDREDQRIAELVAESKRARMTALRESARAGGRSLSR